MSNLIDFYFDFSSPYGYLASTRIEALANRHDRIIKWHPILLGAIFKISGQAPLISYPLKGDYARIDFARSAREYKTPFAFPTAFPVGTVAAARTFYWLDSHSELSDKAVPLIHALFKSYYVDDHDISKPEVVLSVAESLGINKDELSTALADQTVKDKLRVAVENAIELGVFGSPTMIVNDELFWGNDRLEQLDRWLARGGW
jgi:2-hydroxychromene-2-carboxylate isomerase